VCGKITLESSRQTAQKHRLCYEDVNGFCRSATAEEVSAPDCMLAPCCYVGLPDNEDDFGFNERFTKLKAQLKEQMMEEERLNALIPGNPVKIILPDYLANQSNVKK